jgi:hypothetical protein
MTIGRQKHNLCSPNVLLRTVAVGDNRFLGRPRGLNARKI